MSTLRRVLLGALAAGAGMAAAAISAADLGTTFNYQGRLGHGGGAANGLYDFTFGLFDAPAGPNQVGATVAAAGVGVTNGLFTVPLDFGSGAVGGTAYWLEMAVRTNGAGGFTTLTPRQRLLPVPQAIFAVEAGQAGVASGVVNNAVTSDQVADFSLKASDLAPGQVVTSLNGLRDAIGLVVGPNLTLSPSGNALNLDATADWKLGGNAGTASGTHFVGTTDLQDLVFKVNGLESLRLTTSQDLVLPDVPAFILGFGGVNGLGVYGTAYNPILNMTVGRRFGGVDVGGPVLYGQGSGGLGVKTQSGFQQPLVEKLVVQWASEELAVTAQRGIRLQAYDGPIITRGWDPFNASAGTLKSGLGRWGLFMEPGQLVAGIPDLDVPGGDRSFSVQKYAANGVRTELMRVDNRLGYLMVNGAGNEQAYIGGDGVGGDVQIGSLNPNVQNVAFYNGISGSFMHVFVKALTIVGGADLAEPFAMSQPDVAPGAVVVIDPQHPGRLKLSTVAYDRKVAGIVSGAGGIRPGISLIQEDKLEPGKNVALSGRVYVQADAGNGSIEPGDLLTTSARPGYAMKATDSARAQGAVLGKAMTALGDGTGLVLVLVTLQ